MKAKRNWKPLIAVICVLVGLIMLVLCHCAASPYELLPKSFRYGAYAVSAQSFEGDMRPGDLVICDKNAFDFSTGAIVRYRAHMFSSTSFATTTGAAFGRVVAHEPQRGDILDIYTVLVNMNGESVSAMSSRPELAIYRLNGLGAVVMALHSARFIVCGICGAMVLGAALWFVLTAKARRIRRSREAYLALFDGFYREVETDETDF